MHPRGASGRGTAVSLTPCAQGAASGRRVAGSGRPGLASAPDPAKTTDCRQVLETCMNLADSQIFAFHRQSGAILDSQMCAATHKTLNDDCLNQQHAGRHPARGKMCKSAPYTHQKTRQWRRSYRATWRAPVHRDGQVEPCRRSGRYRCPCACIQWLTSRIAPSIDSQESRRP